MLSLLIAFEVIGPCSLKPLASARLSDALTVGEATIRTLESRRIPFQGNEHGINTILSIPTREQSLEILSRTDLRAYGWCFDIDGTIPETYADEIPLDESMKRIRWFHGYAEMKNGQWVSQCQVTAKLRPEFLCGKRQKSSQLSPLSGP